MPDENDLVQEETPVEDRPEWLPERFADPQAFRQSYDEAQRKISELGTDNAQIREELDSLSEQMNAQPQQNQFQQDASQHPLIAAISSAHENGDYANAAILQAELNRQYMEANTPKVKEPEPDLSPLSTLAEMQLRQQWGPEYDKYSPRAAEILQQNPNLVSDSTLEGITSGVQTALRLAREESMYSSQQSLAQQQAEAETARQRKLAAQTATGSGGRPQVADEQSDLWAAIKNSDAGSKFRL